MESPTGVTSSGKICKLCKKKGDLCHLHGGTPRKESKHWKAEYEKEKKAFIDDYHKVYTSEVWHTPISKNPHFPSFIEWLKGRENEPSPKKISSKSQLAQSKAKSIQSKARATQKYRSTLKLQIPEPDSRVEVFEFMRYIDTLPIPALKEVLLNLDKEQLAYVCYYNKRANKLCSQPYFRSSYIEGMPKEKGGYLYTCGYRFDNAGHEDDAYSIPTAIPNFKNVTMVACGSNHTAFIENDKLYTFGSGMAGQLGYQRAEEYSPTLVPFFDKMNITFVACGGSHTAVITKEGDLYTFGSGQYGQIGNGEMRENNLPFKVGLKNVIMIDCGISNTAAIVKGGDLYTFGFGVFGQLGRTNQYTCATPTLVPNLKECNFVACGGNHTAVITKNGKLYTFGLNHHGQLGRESEEQDSVPGMVNLDNPVSVSCGITHTAVITKNGKLYMFGTGYRGELGLGEIEEVFVPTLVPLEKCVFVSTGGEHTAVITRNGKLYTFGSNSNGELGNGRHIGEKVPTLVPNFQNAIFVACGTDFTGVIAGPQKK